MLRILQELPDNLIACGADQLSDALGGPSLIRIGGERKEGLFVSVLLHGNETTGWEAMRSLLQRFRGRRLPRGVDLFIGNVHAARRHRRRLPGQSDFNRIWKGATGSEADMACQLLAQVRARRPALALDIHNTSGSNPPYALCHRQIPDHLALARSFSGTVVLIERPDTMLGVALSSIAPAITMECGRPGIESTERAVSQFLEGLLLGGLPAVPAQPPTQAPLLRCVATVRVPEECSFSFAEREVDLQLMPELDRHNFTIVPAGTLLARVRDGGNGKLQAVDAWDRDVSERFFEVDGDRLVTRVALMPTLLTQDEHIIRQDCLCYLMAPLGADDTAIAATG